MENRLPAQGDELVKLTAITGLAFVFPSLPTLPYPDYRSMRSFFISNSNVFSGKLHRKGRNQLFPILPLVASSTPTVPLVDALKARLPILLQPPNLLSATTAPKAAPNWRKTS